MFFLFLNELIDYSAIIRFDVIVRFKDIDVYIFEGKGELRRFLLYLFVNHFTIIINLSNKILSLLLDIALLGVWINKGDIFLKLLEVE